MKHKYRILLASSLIFAAQYPAQAVNYLLMDFETTATGSDPRSMTGYPEWFLAPTFDKNYGAGNHFEVVDHTAYSGQRSLRFTYTGRNNFCNTCGTKMVLHKDGLDGVDYFVANDGQDLTLLETQQFYPDGKPVLTSNGKPVYTDLPHAQPGRIIYNQDQGYATWEIVAVENENATNDKLIVKPVRPGIGDYARQAPVFNGRDRVSIARQCGVDGSVRIVNGKPAVNDRSDCDSVITWLGNITPGFQGSGQSIFRRVYLKADYIDPPQGQKLHYFIGGRSGAGKEGRPQGANPADPLIPVTTTPKYTQIVPVAEHQQEGNIIEPWIATSGLDPAGGNTRYEPGRGLPANLKFERGVWYYIEQEFKAETYTYDQLVEGVDNNGKGTNQWTFNGYKGDGNGEYRLWIGKAGEEPDRLNPTLELKNLPLAPITGGEGPQISFWGNFQHTRHSRGVWYIDDLVISDQYIGKKPGTFKGKATPSAPDAKKS